MCNQACAIGKNHREAVEISFQSGGPPSAREERLTALMRAALIGHTGAIIDLLACGLDVNAADQHGRTALMEAVYGGHTDAVELLLKQGADVNAKDACGWTALMEAASKSRSCAVETLLAYGADVNAACKSGWTALKVTPRADTEVIRMLKRAEAKSRLNG
ncbi:MAG TPA: ankyrin repeat domain-containing protein [Blastocatellia bacterium]|nr:ankyrin repeat domain-containing protein [Blastocatellia bacterium]